jgi:internalin A
LVSSLNENLNQPTMSELALKLIAENKITKDPFLDLGNCGLVGRLPDELFDCVWLKKLNLGEYYRDKANQKWINSVNEGEKNTFKGNELSILEKLTGLQSLNLVENQILDIHFLEKLTGLQ